MKGESEIRKYLEQKVDPFLKPLLLELMKNRPDEVYQYLKNWIDTKGLEIYEKSKPQQEIEKSAHYEGLKTNLIHEDVQRIGVPLEQIHIREGTELNRASQVQELQQSLHKSLLKEHNQSQVQGEPQENPQSIHQSHHQSVHEDGQPSVYQSHHQNVHQSQHQNVHQSHHESVHQSHHQSVHPEQGNPTDLSLKQSQTQGNSNSVKTSQIGEPTQNYSHLQTGEFSPEIRNSQIKSVLNEDIVSQKKSILEQNVPPHEQLKENVETICDTTLAEN